MNELLRAIGCLALISGAGAEINSRLFSSWKTSLAGICGDDRRPMSWGWSYLMGIAALSLFLYVPLALGGHISHSVFATGWAGCAILSGSYLARHWNPTQWWATFGRSWWFDLPRPACCAVLLVLLAATWFALFTKPATFDGRATFALKARIFYDYGTLQGEDFQDVDRVHFHADYPLLIPLTEAELFWAQGSSDDVHLRSIFLAFVLAITSIMSGEFRRYNSPRVAALATALFLVVPMLSQTGEGSGLSTEADFPLACYAIAGTLAIMQWLRDGNPRQAVLGSLMFGAALMTKDEGLLWSGAAGLAMLIGLGCRRVPLKRIVSPAACFGIAAFMIMLGLVVAVRRQIPISPYLRNYAAVFQWNWLRQLWRRPAAVVLFSLKNFIRTSKWNLIWPCIVATLCLRRMRPLPTDFWYARVLAAIMAVSILGIFILTPYPLYWHLQSALFRLFLQLLPLAWLIAVEQLSASGWTQQLTDLWANSGNKRDEAIIIPLGHEIGLRENQSVNGNASAPARRLVARVVSFNRSGSSRPIGGQ